ncbi:MAG: hypothetical protein OHK0023_24590 [Anaerolineae bacterium]
MDIEGALSGYLLLGAAFAGAVITALWAGLAIWTWRDIRARSRDVVAHFTATALVALLNVFGLLVYLLLRPRETLAEAYERSLEEEALLQNIEEKAICPGCGRATEKAWQLCPHCHTRLRKGCHNCGNLLELAWNVCPFCAATQPDAVESPRRAARSRREGAAAQPSSLEFVDDAE